MSASPDPDTLGDGLHRIRLADGRRAVVKRRRDAPAGFFAAEARGLAALAESRTLRVPQVWGCETHGIVLEDLGNGRAGAADWQQAGERLARLHRVRGASFGLDTPGWCGDSPLDNTPGTDGHRFFAERRLLPQARRAHDSGLLSVAEVTRIERLCLRLPALLPEAAPVLVHGDLWTGNLHACANGELALIDGGAVHHGWAETDLAMLTLFGEPPAGFFAAYESTAGIDGRWRERAPLLNLYHLLNHLNLFGADYHAAVRGVLVRYG
jgi:fructosamine-3-kinase